MTHDNVIERLDDSVGGELPAPERAAVDLHLAGCAECRAEADALRALLEEVSALPAEVLPPRELWSGIAARLEPRMGTASPALRAAQPRQWMLPRWAMQTAAAVTLMLGTGLAVRSWGMPAAPGGGKEPSTMAPVVARKATTALAAFEPAEQDYQAAISELQSALDTQRSRLAPETVQTLEMNLAIIDEAIRQSRAALGRDPNSAELARMLGQAYDRKLEVLQHAVQL